jgi:hypothetical protein
MRKIAGAGKAHSTQSRTMSSHLPSTNIKVRIYRTIILPAVQNGCDTQSLNIMGEQTVMEHENRVVTRIF